MKTRNAFTLVELLVVITIICILAGLVLSGINTANRYVKRIKAKTQVSGLLVAIKNFETQYGVLPAPDGIVSGNSYTTLVNILSNDTSDATVPIKNTRGITFLSPTKPGEFKDQWGQNFIVVLNSTKQITSGPYETVFNSVAVWSTGENKIDNKGEFNPARQLDDINSWR